MGSRAATDSMAVGTTKDFGQGLRQEVSIEHDIGSSPTRAQLPPIDCGCNAFVKTTYDA